MSDGHYNSVPSAEACQQDCQVQLDGKSSLDPAPARMILDLFFRGSSLNTHDAHCYRLSHFTHRPLLMILMIIDLLSKASSRCLFWTWDESYHGACWQKFQANPVNSHLSYEICFSSKLIRYFKRSVLLLKTRLPDLAWSPGQNIAGSKPLRWIKNILSLS